MKLEFVIIGGQKCGSTYLHSVINEHPDIEMVPGESPQLENPDFNEGGLEDLGHRLNALDQSKTLGIKRPNYLALEEVPQRISAINKNARLIAIIRDPLERFKSSYFHYINYGFCPLLPLNDGVQSILTGELSAAYPRTTDILKFGFYSHHLMNYHRLFGGNLLILTYDELSRNRLDVIKKCYTFLGVDPTFIPEKALNSRPQKGNYSLKRAWFKRFMYRYRYSYNEDKTRLFEKNQSAGEKMIYGLLYLIDKYIVGHIYRMPKPDYSESMRQALNDAYAGDIKDLERQFSLDLSNWK
jgi:hypothetical protein